MKLLKINKNITDNIETIELKNLHFCLGQICKKDKDRIVLEMLYAAHKTDNSVISIIQRFEINSNEVDSLLDNRLFEIDEAIESNKDFLERNGIVFFVEETDVYITDFIVDYNNSTNRYEFYANHPDTDDETIIKFSISRSVHIGLNLLQSRLPRLKMDNDFLLEANEWMGDHIPFFSNAEFSTINSFELLDLTKTIKLKKNTYKGIAIIKFNVTTSQYGINKEYLCPMIYIVKKPIRDKYRTKDQKLLSIIYREDNPYSVINYKSEFKLSDGESITQLIAVNLDAEHIILEFKTSDNIIGKIYDKIRG